MQTVLLVIHVIIAVSLIGIILIQRSDSDGFGLGSGSGSNFMTGRGAANFLTRTTSILATLFILNSLVLGIIAARTSSSSILDTIEAQQEQTVPATLEQSTEEGAAPTAGKAETQKEQPAKKEAREQKSEPTVPTE